MLTQSHLFLAKKIVKKFNKELDSNSFLLGNIMPDFIPWHKKKEHTFESSVSYVLYEIHLIKKLNDINIISYKLGIISHYLADFFCKAHNCEEMQKGLWQHFKYESLLHSVLISANIELPIENDIYKIKTFLKKKYERYMLEELSVVVDIQYSLEVCQNIIYFILQMKDKQEQEVA